MHRQNIAAGVYVYGRLWVQERWDVREIIESTIYIWNDIHDVERLNDKLALLIPTPVYCTN